MTDGQAMAFSIAVLSLLVIGLGGWAIRFRIKKQQRLKEKLEEEELERRIRQNTLTHFNDIIVTTTYSINEE